jgi:uncharacterized membrane protein
MNRLCEAGVARGRGKAWLLLLAGAAVVGGVCGGAAGQGLAPCRFEVADIIQAPSCGITGPPATIATAISPNGRYVAGYHAQCATSDDEAFIYDRQTREFRTLPRPQGVYSSRCHDVNDSGVAVGGYWKVDQGRRGFLYDILSASYVSELQAPGTGYWCEAMAINSKGQVCGYRSLDDGGDPVNPLNAFVWEAGKYTDIGVLNGPNSTALDIADDGTVVGWTGANLVVPNTLPFVWRDGEAEVLPLTPGSIGSGAVAISSADGRVAVQGLMQFVPSTFRTFVYQSGQYVNVGVLPGFTHTIPSGVRGGMLVGRCQVDTPNQRRAVLWFDGTLHDLNDLMTKGATFEISDAFETSRNGDVLARTSNGGVAAVILERQGINDGDLDENCRTDADDLILVILEWGIPNSAADADGDGDVDAADLSMVIFNWTE